MKTKLSLFNWLLALGSLVAMLTLCGLLTAGKAPGKYIAHEWGTFTSVQGGDGVLLDWRPLESSKLPGFVYNWTRPGLQRQATSPLAPIKAQILTLQRMETPVIYFYANKRQTVDVSVGFPSGLITEWYPQAEQIGPSTTRKGPMLSKLDEYAHEAGISAEFSFASLVCDNTTSSSRAKWAEVEIIPPRDSEEPGCRLQSDK